MRISASSTSLTIDWSVASTLTTSRAASTIPSATESTEAESTVPRITPESAATTASRPPNSRTASLNPMPMPYMCWRPARSRRLP